MKSALDPDQGEEMMREVLVVKPLQVGKIYRRPKADGGGTLCEHDDGSRPACGPLATGGPDLSSPECACSLHMLAEIENRV